jgi:hypothetical protein
MSLTQEQYETIPPATHPYVISSSKIHTNIPQKNNPHVLLKGKCLSKIVIICNSIKSLHPGFPIRPVKCELDFQFGFDTVHTFGQLYPSDQG